jgi:hypothetical protein
MKSGQAWRMALLWSMFAIVSANYLAQIPYYLRLYYFPHHAAPALAGTLALGATFLWFLLGFALLWRGQMLGYWLTLGFLATETGFYLYNTVGSILHGYPPFFHLADPDPILWSVFAIGYLNMLAGLVFIAMLLLARRALTPVSAAVWLNFLH